MRTLEQFAAHGALALRDALRADAAARRDGRPHADRQPPRVRAHARLRALAGDARGRGRERRHARRRPLQTPENDAYGHQTGDDALRRVAATLDSASRDYDTAARYGGEEFVLLLPRTGPKEAIAIAERLRGELKASGEEPAVTASFGVATFPAHAREASALLAAADQALYASKRDGRDRVRLAEGEGVELGLAS